MSAFIHNHLVKTTVAAIITRKSKDGLQVLLTRRGYPPYKDQWCLPGGHIDEYETAQHAIIREVKEEVGLDFEARFFTYFDEIILAACRRERFGCKNVRF
jgi:8-oxo-dGTP diphosphatase